MWSQKRGKPPSPAGNFLDSKSVSSISYHQQNSVDLEYSFHLRVVPINVLVSVSAVL